MYRALIVFLHADTSYSYAVTPLPNVKPLDENFASSILPFAVNTDPFLGYMIISRGLPAEQTLTSEVVGRW